MLSLHQAFRCFLWKFLRRGWNGVPAACKLERLPCCLWLQLGYRLVSFGIVVLWKTGPFLPGELGCLLWLCWLISFAATVWGCGGSWEGEQQLLGGSGNKCQRHDTLWNSGVRGCGSNGLFSEMPENWRLFGLTLSTLFIWKRKNIIEISLNVFYVCVWNCNHLGWLWMSIHVHFVLNELKAIHTESVIVIHPHKTQVLSGQSSSSCYATIIVIHYRLYHSWAMGHILYIQSTYIFHSIGLSVLCICECVGVCSLCVSYSLAHSSTGLQGSASSTQLPWLPLLTEDHLSLPHYGLDPHSAGTGIMMASVVANGNQGSQSLVLKGVDPETCMIVFKNHWAQVRASLLRQVRSGWGVIGSSHSYAF